MKDEEDLFWQGGLALFQLREEEKKPVCEWEVQGSHCLPELEPMGEEPFITGLPSRSVY